MPHSRCDSRQVSMFPQHRHAFSRQMEGYGSSPSLIEELEAKQNEGRESILEGERDVQLKVMKRAISMARCSGGSPSSTAQRN